MDIPKKHLLSLGIAGSLMACSVNVSQAMQSEINYDVVKQAYTDRYGYLQEAICKAFENVKKGKAADNVAIIASLKERFNIIVASINDSLSRDAKSQELRELFAIFGVLQRLDFSAADECYSKLLSIKN
jgi:hypothetical protein